MENKLIEQLAQKLGTTTEYLWGILVQQAFINSVITLFQFLLIGLFGYAILKTHKYLLSERRHGKYIRTGYSHYGDPAEITMIIMSVLFVILAVAGFFELPDLVNGFLNPEYWALNKILNTVK